MHNDRVTGRPLLVARASLLLVVVLALSACGGGGSSSTPGADSSGTTSTSGQSGNALLYGFGQNEIGVYVALAEALDATLITRDGPLARGVATTIDVVLAG